VNDAGAQRRHTNGARRAWGSSRVELPFAPDTIEYLASLRDAGEPSKLDGTSLREAVDELPAPLRRVVEGYHWERRSFSELARELNVSRPLLYVWHRKALDLLRSALCDASGPTKADGAQPRPSGESTATTTPA
jgi:DNA-directed RNA polymerase specialized sigma24 family protein